MADVNPYAPKDDIDGKSGLTEESLPSTPFAGPQEYQRGPMHGWLMMGCTVGGIFSIGIGMLMFAVHLFLITGSSNPISLHLSTTMPVLMGLFALINAYQLAQSPQVVRLWPEGIEIEGTSPIKLPWSQIHRVSVEEVPMSKRKKIDLKDEADKTIYTIHGGLHDFENLITDVKSKVNPPARIGESPKAEDIHRKRGRMRAIGFACAGILTLLGFGFMLYEANWMRYRDQQLASAAVVGSGQVIERRVAPNGVTKRLYVKVVGDEGKQHQHNFEVEESLFNTVGEGDDVPVTFVPADPRIAELTQGQVSGQDVFKSPLGSLLIAVAMGLMSLMFWSVGVMAWKGYDLKWENSRFRLVPLGE